MMIIDFHAHTFPEKISAKVAESLSQMAHTIPFIDPNTHALAESMKQAGVDLSVNLPVMTNPGQVVSVNDRLIEQTEQLQTMGIITFGGLHPSYGDCRGEIRRLREHGIKGVKLHPAYQGIDLNDPVMKRIMDAASEEGLVTIVHSGWDIGIPHHNYSSVPMILDVINDVAPERFVLAHMGGWQCWEEIRKDLAGAPVWFDTAFALGKMTAREGEEYLLHYKENLTQEAFVQLAREHGTEKILFATDSPWAAQEEYLAFLRGADLTEQERSRILGENAAALLNL